MFMLKWSQSLPQTLGKKQFCD